MGKKGQREWGLDRREHRGIERGTEERLNFWKIWGKNKGG